MAKSKAKSKTDSNIIITKAVTTTTKPKEKKPQVKIPTYEVVIDSWLADPTPNTLMKLIDQKFKGKDVSTGTIADVRGELFSLMTYVENNVRFDKTMTTMIAKTMEGIVVEGSSIRHKS